MEHKLQLLHISPMSQTLQTLKKSRPLMTNRLDRCLEVGTNDFNSQPCKNDVLDRLKAYVQEAERINHA